LYGGQMIDKVDEQNSTWNKLPLKFEAGTPNICEVISLGASIDFIKSIGFSEMNEHLNSITNAYLELLSTFKDINIYGQTNNRGPVISFNIKNIHAYDFCQIMGQHNISLRAGNHCAQPLLQEFGTNSTNRISFQIYNTIDELNYFNDKLKQTIALLS